MQLGITTVGLVAARALKGCVKQGEGPMGKGSRHTGEAVPLQAPGPQPPPPEQDTGDESGGMPCKRHGQGDSQGWV